MTVTTPPRRTEIEQDRDFERRVGALEPRIEGARGSARRRRIHAGVVLGLTLVLAAIVFASGSPAAGLRPCTGSKHGWWVQCGPAIAVVTVRGVSHAIAHGACNGPHGGRLDFGVYSPRATPHLGFGLRFDASRAGIVNVVDGELEMVPAFEWLSPEQRTSTPDSGAAPSPSTDEEPAAGTLAARSPAVGPAADDAHSWAGGSSGRRLSLCGRARR